MSENVLGPIIKKIRREKKMTQKEVGQLTGYSQNTISNHENRKRALSESSIAKYARALDITPQQLFDESNKFQKSPSKKYLQSQYNYLDLAMSTGLSSDVNPFKSENVIKITLADIIMGKYAGDEDIFITRINGESMNRVITNNSLIAVKKIESWRNLRNGDIVLFEHDGKLAVKHFYFDWEKQLISFKPNSNDDSFTELSYHLDNLENLKIWGRVVIYTTEL